MTKSSKLSGKKRSLHKEKAFIEQLTLLNIDVCPLLNRYLSAIFAILTSTFEMEDLNTAFQSVIKSSQDHGVIFHAALQGNNSTRNKKRRKENRNKIE